MTYYDLPAPAKLNLFLHVVGQRPDGYHLLQSVFRLISLSDSITLDLRTDGVISRDSDMDEHVADVDDLVVKAAHRLKAATATNLGAHIVVRKRIPSGGGLGGGSSDAATVLLGLNRLWRTGLSRSALMSLGLKLGADVPFFLLGQTAFVTGVGEQVQATACPDASYLVFKPAATVPTSEIFKDLDLTRDTEPVKISDFSGRVWYAGPEGFGRNDLEAVTRRRYPIVDDAMNWVGLQGHAVRLTGSGSCFFAEFDSPAQAKLAQADLIGKMRNSTTDIAVNTAEGSKSSSALSVLPEVFVCDGLPRHPLAQWLEV